MMGVLKSASINSEVLIPSNLPLRDISIIMISGHVLLASLTASLPVNAIFGTLYPQFSSFNLSTEAEILSSSTTNTFAVILSHLNNSKFILKQVTFFWLYLSILIYLFSGSLHKIVLLLNVLVNLMPYLKLLSLFRYLNLNYYLYYLLMHSCAKIIVYFFVECVSTIFWSFLSCCIVNIAMAKKIIDVTNNVSVKVMLTLFIRSYSL